MVSRSQRWQTMSSQMADRLNNADLQAAAYINSSMPSIYALNHDYTCFQIDQAGIMEGGSFTLTNERAVRELILGGNHVNFRTVNPNPIRNYQWNQQRIQQIVTRGILTGKSIDGIAADFLGVMKNNTSAAIRNARTAVTSAQAAGCQEAFDEAAEMGIEFEKEWIATSDDRTRESHAELDGERVANDDVFSNGLMYPCDPKGDPSEVYNCRCTMRAVLPGMDERKASEEEKLYTEWRDQQQEIEGEKSIDQKEVELLNAAENDEKTETVEVETQDISDEISGTELNNEDENGIIEKNDEGYSIDKDTGHIIVDEVMYIHKVPIEYKPFSVIEHHDEIGRLYARIYYGEDGRKYKEINFTNHNRPKFHKFGINGEHAHDTTWDESGNILYRTSRELTDAERRENGDIFDKH